MDKPTVFADTYPCWGIRVAQAAGVLFRVVNDHTFAGVATYLVNHCSHIFISTTPSKNEWIKLINICGSLIVRLLSTAQSRLRVHQQQA